jgi:DNA damage-binding protein 1
MFPSFLFFSFLPPVSQIQIFKLIIKDENMMSNFTGSSELQNECHHQGHIMTLFLKSSGDYLIVGDLVRSVSLLRYRSAESTLEEVSRDYNSNFMRAIEIMDNIDDYYLGCDDHANLFYLHRYHPGDMNTITNTPVIKEEAMKLEVRGEYHLGDYVNVLRRGTLTIQPIDSSSSSGVGNNQEGANNHGSSSSSTSSGISSAADIFDANYKSVTGFPIDKCCVMYGTISGAIGNILALSESSYRFFHIVEKAMKNIIVPVGGFPHDEWRNFQNEMRSSPQRNIVDGDLVEMLLDLSKDQLEMLAKEVNEELSSSASSSVVTSSLSIGDQNEKMLSNMLSSATNLLPEEIYRRVEDIARLH